MRERIKFYLIKKEQRAKAGEPTRVFVLAFAIIIAIGTALLLLPAASRSGRSCGVLTAFFTATSATCVTGLVVGDTYTLWSTFGQWVIICLIQIGGLGFMTISCLFSMLLRRRINLRERLVLAQSFNVSGLEGIVRLVKHVIIGTFALEFTGGLILCLRFIPMYGFWPGVARGFFHAVSGFCNAGFDILGRYTAGDSLISFGSDPVVLITLALLINIGGLGFFVWEDLINCRSIKNISLHSKLVLSISAVLLLGGTGALLLTEWSNPLTLGDMNFWQKLLAAFFQASTLRTAGFDALGQTGLTDGGKAVSMVLMLIGGSPGSTAGGIKTVTIGVLLISALATLRGRKYATVFGHTITWDSIQNALSVTLLMVMLAFFGAVLITCTHDISLTDALYETVSALATVGLTAGVTPSLAGWAKVLIAVYMFFGRVGLMTIGLALAYGEKNEGKLKYANGQVFIG